MPRSELARDRAPTDRIARVIDALRGGRPGTDPVQAEWDDPDAGPSFGYYNFALERHEWGRGRIPRHLLWMYLPEARERRIYALRGEDRGARLALEAGD